MVAIRDEFMHPGPQPNGLQATKDGLWVIDQGDNHLYKLNYETGEILEKCATETLYSSGVTLGGGNIWISSTYSAEIFQCNFDGTTLAKYDTPGKGIAAFANPENQIVTGAHGMEWIDEHNMWVVVPPAQRVYLMDPETMTVNHSIPSPGVRPHGIFMHNDSLWLADTGDCKVHRIAPDTGDILDVIEIPTPEVHGMTIHDGLLWFCCAETRRICTVQLPT